MLKRSHAPLGRRIWLPILAALCVFQTASAALASEVYAIFRKADTEWIIALRNHDTFPAAGLTLDLAAMPSQFQGSLFGADFSVIGIFDPTFRAGTPSVVQQNIMFSSPDDPNGLTNGQITSSFNAINGFENVHRASLPALGNSKVLPAADPDSFSTRVAGAGNDFGGQIAPRKIIVPVLDDRPLVPVFGVARSVSPATTFPQEYGVAFPLKLELTGTAALTTSAKLSIVTQVDLKSETYAVFTKTTGTGVRELIVNLGSHDDLSAGGVIDISSKIPASFGPTGLAGSTFSVVGFFDEENVQPNLMFSSTTGVPALTPTQVTEAFTRLSKGPSGAGLGFLDLHSDLAPGDVKDIPATDPASFANTFGSTGGGNLPPVGGNVVSPGGLSIANIGAADLPFEVGQIQTITVSLPGLITGN